MKSLSGKSIRKLSNILYTTPYFPTSGKNTVTDYINDPLDTVRSIF
jgi:hypothetical protein